MPPRPMPLMLLKASVPMPRPSYLKSNSSVCLPGASASGAFPANALQVHQVPEEHRLALEQVEAVAAEPAAGGQQHALGAARRHFDVGRDGVGAVQQQRRVALRDAGQRPRVDELACGRP